jgi:hypothetical protein
MTTDISHTDVSVWPNLVLSQRVGRGRFNPELEVSLG